MTEQYPSPLVKIDPWSTYGLRLTAFPSPSAQIDSSHWWKETVGIAPETQQINRKAGVIRDEGPFGKGRLLLEVQPAKIDWRFTSLVEEEAGVILLERLLPLETTLNSFVPAMNRWLRISPSTIRLAFGAYLATPVGDRPTGYTQLSRFLHYVQLDPVGASDFFYQVNRPRESKTILGLRLNRLTKWSVLLASSAQLVLGSGNRIVATQNQEVLARHLELDVNTAAENTTEFRNEDLLPLWEELAQLGREIADKGDIP